MDAATLLSWELKFTDKSTGAISAVSSPSVWTTSGEQVTIRVNTQDDGQVKVDVTSTLVEEQKLDWEKGRKNIKAFYKKLDGLMAAGKL